MVICLNKINRYESDNNTPRINMQIISLTVGIEERAISIEVTITQHFVSALGSPPLFASQHPNIYIFETDANGNKQDLVVPCSIDNPSSTVNYTWFKGNQELPGSMVNGEGSLVIPNITEGEYASRKGVDYYCIASDNIGFDVAVKSRTITVFYTCESM